MAHELNIPNHSSYASRGQNRHARRIDESKKWVSPYIDVIKLLENETRINHNRHPYDLTKVAWTKNNIIATKYGADSSILTAMADNGLCTQTIVGVNAEKVFLAYVKRITGVGRVDITTDGVTWTNVTRKINSDSYTPVITKTQMLEHCVIGFRLGTYRDEIAVGNVQSVEL